MPFLTSANMSETACIPERRVYKIVIPIIKPYQLQSEPCKPNNDAQKSRGLSDLCPNILARLRWLTDLAVICMSAKIWQYTSGHKPTSLLLLFTVAATEFYNSKGSPTTFFKGKKLAGFHKSKYGSILPKLGQSYSQQKNYEMFTKTI
jgi:hypothetical protein